MDIRGRGDKNPAKTTNESIRRINMEFLNVTLVCTECQGCWTERAIRELSTLFDESATKTEQTFRNEGFMAMSFLFQVLSEKMISNRRAFDPPFINSTMITDYFQPATWSSVIFFSPRP